ncbi:hypothetical protein O3M35_007515 [Rhynocoris fuscipes]|uniref:N-acetyltransferase ESCO2 n=1 Tax=Rhynocoris fuscipes TaxID=488301 RepID=A0AAW1D9P4_9HEMI
MEEVMNGCTTPNRVKQRGVLRERQVMSETRRSLFDKGDSDLSDISPLSRTSSELMSPVKNSPIKIITPFKLRGVSRLSPNHGVIKPSSFYGASWSAPAVDRAELHKQVRRSIPDNCKARTSLFLDDLPKNKKRSRSSGNPDELIKQVKKKIKLQPNLRHDIRKPSKTEIRQREILKRKKAMREQKEREKKLKEKKAPEKRKYNWDFFNTSGDLQKLNLKSSVIMTPPRSSKKKRFLTSNLEFLSPEKVVGETKEDTEVVESNDEKNKAHDQLVKEIREGVLDMMKDDFEDDVSNEVNVLLEKLEEDVENEPISLCDQLAKDFSFDDDVENIEPNTPPEEKLYEIFCTPKNSKTVPKLDLSSQKKTLGVGMDQLQLDVGQKNLREIECSGCGLMYVDGNPEDVEAHRIFHFNFKELRFNGWKNERVVRYDGAGKVICVRNTDPKPWWKKALSVLEIIDNELGYPPNGPEPSQIYLYITEKFIRGVVAVSKTLKAHKMLHIEGNEDVGLCSEEEYPVKCLISRIWVDRHFRRCNIATVLLDSVRSNYTFGYILKCSDLAFSSPTDDGRKFIENYTKTKEYFVYT